MCETEPGPILVVEHDEEIRDLIGAWLQGAGYDILTCPGPLAPDYSCIGGRAWHCALVVPASLVVLDLSFSPDAIVQASVGVNRLGYYLLTNKPIITLGRGDDLLAGPAEGQVIALERIPNRRDFLATVRSAVSA